MKIIARIALSALALIAIAACAKTTTTTTTATDSWPEFRMPGADFAVSMPNQPVVGRDTTAKDGSISRTYHDDEGATVYMAAYNITHPKSTRPAPLDGWLDNVRHDLVRKMGGTLRSERRLMIGDAHGMEILLDVPKTGDSDAYTMRARVYVRHMGSGKALTDILYQTITVTELGHGADPAITRFLDSFHFVSG